MKPLVQLLLAALLAFVSAATVQADKMPARLPTLTEAAEAAGNLDALLMIIEQLGYEQYLLESSSITVFAFTDEAFQALYPSMRESLFSPGNEDLLSDFLVYHIVPDSITAAEVPTAGTQVITLKSAPYSRYHRSTAAFRSMTRLLWSPTSNLPTGCSTSLIACSCFKASRRRYLR